MQAWAKWLPSDPTSPHWYDGKTLGRLVAAYLSNEATAGRTVRMFVSEFRGLTHSAKQKAVLASANLGAEPLAALVANKDIDHKLIGQLLTAMQAHSNLIEPKALGQIGRKHFEVQFGENACEMDSFNYNRAASTTNGVPWVIEVAFAWCPNLGMRRLVTGVNWSPGILNPFRELGSFGQSLDEVLTLQRCDRYEPVVLALHLICPGVKCVTVSWAVLGNLSNAAVTQLPSSTAVPVIPLENTWMTPIALTG